jgi:lysophospholipase L1-like esterase
MNDFNRIIVVGDSHAYELSLGLEETGRIAKDKLKVFSYRGVSAYSIKYDDFKVENYKNDLVLVCFGEADIRRYLPKYDNADMVVDLYIKKTLKTFKDSTIVFLEPPPQVIDIDYKEIEYKNKYHNNKPYTLSDRLSQQLKFNSCLNSYSINLIKMKDIFNLEVLDLRHTDDGCHLNSKYARVVAESVCDYLENCIHDWKMAWPSSDNSFVEICRKCSEFKIVKENQYWSNN